LCQARSKEVAQYLIEVPTFTSAISDSKFLKEDTLTRPHGLVWPLLLRAGNRQNKSPAVKSLTQAEDMLNLEVNHTAEIADDQELISNTVVLTVSWIIIHVERCYYKEQSGNLDNICRIGWMWNMFALTCFGLA
jgi:hypothetical protein